MEDSDKLPIEVDGCEKIATYQFWNNQDQKTQYSPEEINARMLEAWLKLKKTT